MSADDLTERMAHLIVRQAMTLDEEGIGVDEHADTDEATIGAAVALVRDSFDDHELWDAGLLLDTEHDPTGCRRCERFRAAGIDRGTRR